MFIKWMPILYYFERYLPLFYFDLKFSKKNVNFRAIAGAGKCHCSFCIDLYHSLLKSRRFSTISYDFPCRHTCCGKDGLFLPFQHLCPLFILFLFLAARSWLYPPVPQEMEVVRATLILSQV